MPRKIINLRFPATCADCGEPLEKGARARYYGRGKVYGVDCHEDARESRGNGRQPRRVEHLPDHWDGDTDGYSPGLTASRADPTGLYTHDGTRIGGASCGCEDYPCCGH